MDGLRAGPAEVAISTISWLTCAQAGLLFIIGRQLLAALGVWLLASGLAWVRPSSRYRSLAPDSASGPNPGSVQSLSRRPTRC